MSGRAKELSGRPDQLDTSGDVIADVLETMRFSTLFFGRFELGAPWVLRVPKKPTSSFYVVARGGLRLAVAGIDHPLALGTGDVVLLPGGAGHALDDGMRRAPSARDVIASESLRGSPRKLGGEGPTTALIVGCFSFAAGAEHPLLTALPPVIHLPADEPRLPPSFPATVHLIAAESAAPGPGSAIVLGRLADVLLVHALRLRATLAGPDEVGLRALADPAIGAALGLIHARPSEPWTVERLASQVGLSRSGFAARFHALVGETPLRYVARWRMLKAASWLRETSDSVPQIAERVGYESAPAFHKAFKQWQGVGPGAYRRAGQRALQGPQARGQGGSAPRRALLIA
jgi:AraC-like DNA-binding protein